MAAARLRWRHVLPAAAQRCERVRVVPVRLQDDGRARGRRRARRPRRRLRAARRGAGRTDHGGARDARAGRPRVGPAGARRAHARHRLPARGRGRRLRARRARRRRRRQARQHPACGDRDARARRRAARGPPAGAGAPSGDHGGQPRRPPARRAAVSSGAEVRLGLRENLAQFSLLVAINAFVGAMVGLERSTLPLIGRESFGLTSSAAVLSFIVAFGLAKALTNLAAGATAERIGRRRLLIAGWAFALPVPLLVAVAPTWAWIVAANVLLG